MTRRLALVWPDASAFKDRGHREPIRILAVSDDRDPALEHPGNREQLGQLDLIVGAGDLEPDYLSFLADAFVAPLVYIRGNHDAGGAWGSASRARLPEALPDGAVRENVGLPFIGLSWPTLGVRGRAPEGAAWRQILPLIVRSLSDGRRPIIVVSHVPPRGLGDAPGDPFHTGFRAYRWVADHLRPVLWVHGHTHPASQGWRVDAGPTTLVNVTGAVLLELKPPNGQDKSM